MIVVNFSHPLTDAQRAQAEALTGMTISRVIEIMPQVDVALPFAEQVRAILDTPVLSAVEWQTLPLVVNLPGLAPLAAALLAELHGRMGYFPTILRLRPVNGSTPTRYEVAEVINLHAIRETARAKRVEP